MGRKHYRCKTGGKHKPRGAVPFWYKHKAWWEDLVTPSKTRDKREAKKEIRKELEEY